jgi:hypothetical protein
MKGIRPAHTRVQAGERANAVDRVLYDGNAERGEARRVAVRAQYKPLHLGIDALDDASKKRLPGDDVKRLVGATHPLAMATREDNCGVRAKAVCSFAHLTR